MGGICKKGEQHGKRSSYRPVRSVSGILQLKTPEQCYRFLQDVCSYSELSAMEQRYNIAEMLVDKRIYTEIMDKTGASSAIISRVSRVLSANDSVLRALLEAEKAADDQN